MPSIRRPSLSAVRHALIDARTSREGFQAALGEIAGLVGARGALAFVPSHDFSAGYALDHVGWQMDDLHEEAQNEAASHGIMDPWRVGGEKKGAFVTPMVAIGEELASQADLDRSPWGRFFNSFDIRHLLGYAAPAREFGAPHVLLSLYRTPSQGPFTETERRLVEAVAVEFDATAELRLSLAPDAPRLDATLTNIAEPAFVIGRGHVVTGANEAAIRMVEDGTLLRIAANMLTAARPPQAEAVGGAILRALHGRSGVVSLLRVAGRHLFLRASPVRVDGQTVALVRVRDALDRRAPAAWDLITLFALSPAEAEVALAMFEHLTAKEIARRRGVALETIRTQIRSVCEKLGVRRASEAIAVMARLVE